MWLTPSDSNILYSLWQELVPLLSKSIMRQITITGTSQNSSMWREKPVIPKKRKWLEWAINRYKWQDMPGKVWIWTEMYDWTFLWMAGKGLKWPKRAGNSWKQKSCLLLRLKSTRNQQFYWTFAALFLPSCSLATNPYAEKVWMLRDSTASVLSRTRPSCGSALKWALADWCCYGFCRLESRN